MFLPHASILLSGLANEFESMPKAHLEKIVEVRFDYFVFWNRGPGDHVEGHLLENIFDVDHAVLLRRLFEVDEHLVDSPVQEVEHSLDLAGAERWAQTFPQILC